jgi:hypothetical protein
MPLPGLALQSTEHMADGPNKENAPVVPPPASHPERRGHKRVVTRE